MLRASKTGIGLKTWVIYTVLLGSLASFASGQNLRVSSAEELPFHSQVEKELVTSAEFNFERIIFATAPSASFHQIEKFEKAYAKNLQKFQRRAERSKNDQHFLKSLFYTVHRKSLKWYEQYVPFAELFESGRYDCLTATSLYSMYLRDLGYYANIVETEYHVYIKVKTGDGEVILETTDALEGFISRVEDITAVEKNYSAANNDEVFQGISSNRRPYEGRIINESVSAKELIGLHYYNQAIASWNNKRVKEARNLISKACYFYPSERVQGMRRLFFEDRSLLLARQN